MTRTIGRLALATLLAVAAGGCKGKGGDASGGAPVAATPAPGKGAKAAPAAEGKAAPTGERALLASEQIASEAALERLRHHVSELIASRAAPGGDTPKSRLDLMHAYQDLALATGEVGPHLEVLKLYDTAPPEAHESYQFGMARFRSLVALGRTQAARRAVRALPPTTPTWYRALARGAVAFLAGRFEEARAPLLEAADDPSTASEANALLGRVEDALDHARAAEVYFARAAEAAADSPVLRADAAFARGEARRARGRLTDARNDYHAALAAFAGHIGARLGLVETDLAAGERNLAVARLRGIVALVPHPGALARLGELLEAAGKTGEAKKRIAAAKKRYEAALRAAPEAVWVQAARFFLGPGKDPPRALALAKKALAARPTAARAALLAEAALAAGDRKAALAAVERAFGYRDRSARVHLVAAKVYEAAGDTRKASLQRALAFSFDPTLSGR